MRKAQLAAILCEYEEKLWTPVELGGAAIWLRSDTRVTLNVSNVTAWGDLSGNANDMSQGTVSLQPTIATNVLNGRAGILFDNVDDQLTLASSTQLNWERTQAWSAFVVAKLTAVASDDTLFSKGNPLTGGYGMQIAGSGTLRVNEANSGVNRMVVGATMTTDNVAEIYEATYDGGSSAATSVSVWQNGTAKTTSATVDSLTATILNASKFAVGGQDGTTAGPFGGYIFEVLLFTRVVTSLERQMIESYLRLYWGI